MLERCLALLAPALEAPGAVVVDGTIGLGGHSEAMLRTFPSVRLVGIDRDTEAIELSRQRLEPYAERLTLVHAVYDELPQTLASVGLNHVQGVLLDLGVSSMQLDELGRGFAYRADAPLDMRMDRTSGITAAEVLNTYSVDELARILKQYGEERFARRIAAAVVRERARTPIDSTARLAELVREAVPAATRRTGGHPAKRTFQALRIEVNGELDVLRRAIPAAVDALAVQGRIVVLSYQSLEDRIVKQVFRQRANSDVPPDLPIIPEGHEPELRLLTRGAETPSDEEVAANPRAASARCRAAQRLRTAA